MVLRALRWQYLLAPIGHARFGAGVSHDHHRVCGERRAAGAGRRGDSPVSAGAAGRAERHGDLRDHHHRTAARRGDVRHAARVVRAVLRSGDGQRRQPAVLARRSRRRRSSARSRLWCSARCSWRRAIRRRSAAGPTSSSICCPGKSTHKLAEVSVEICRRAGGGADAEAARVGACCCRFRCGCRSARASGR